MGHFDALIIQLVAHGPFLYFLQEVNNVYVFVLNISYIHSHVRAVYIHASASYSYSLQFIYVMQKVINVCVISIYLHKVITRLVISMLYA